MSDKEQLKNVVGLFFLIIGIILLAWGVNWQAAAAAFFLTLFVKG